MLPIQVCQTRAWMLSMGFTLSYGAMFSKVWRVHRFTTKQKQDPKVRIKRGKCCRADDKRTALYMRKEEGERRTLATCCKWCTANEYTILMTFMQQQKNRRIDHYYCHFPRVLRFPLFARFNAKRSLKKKNEIIVELKTIWMDDHLLFPWPDEFYFFAFHATQAN